jgi:hypothetical protein
MILVSTVAVAMAGVLREFEHYGSLRQNQVFATVLGAVVFIGQVLGYLFSERVVTSRNDWSRRSVWRRILLPLALILLVGIVVFAASKVAPRWEQAILTRRLASISNQVQSPAEKREDVESRVLTYSLQSGITVSDEFVAKVKGDSEGDPNAWNTYVTAVNYIFNQRATKGRRITEFLNLAQDRQPREIIPLPNPWAEPNPEKIPLCVQANQVRLETSTIFLPKPGDVFGLRSLREEEDVSRRWPQGTCGCRVVLDGQGTKDMFLFQLIIDYSGGPIELTNVRFGVARLRLLKDNANTRRLADALVKATDNVVNLTLR